MALDIIDGAQGAADFLGVSRSVIYGLVRHERIPVIRKGRKLFFRKSELEAAFRSVA